MIGIFDSGVGGLSVLGAIRSRIASHPLLFLADQANVPYGPRPPQQIRTFSEAISRELINQGAGPIVVACNTASAAALDHLRAVFPETKFVGMEPAVKPAAARTRSGVVGVLATPPTFQASRYSAVVDRFARGVTVLSDTCPGLVEQIERGELDSPGTRQILEQALEPMLARHADTIVLGCTHYPFVAPLIRAIVGPQVVLIDPAPAVARQTLRLLPPQASQPRTAQNGIRIATTGDPQRLNRMLPRFSEEKLVAEPASAIRISRLFRRTCSRCLFISTTKWLAQNKFSRMIRIFKGNRLVRPFCRC